MKQRELERLDKAIYPTPARKRHFKRIACYALFGAAMAISATAPLSSTNDKGDIVGFFSDGTHVNGFVQFNAPVGPQ
jgi:hypothetical protein